MKTFLFVAAIALLAVGLLYSPGYAQGSGNCLDPDTPGYIKEDSGGTSVTISADPGFVISSVTVKAGSDQSTGGNQCITLTASNECYSVSGLGTGSVTVTKIGSGPSCKDISHLEAIEVETSTETSTPPTETPPTETPPTVTETPPTGTATPPTQTTTPAPPTEESKTPDPTTPAPTTPVPYNPPTGTPEALLPVTGGDFNTPKPITGFAGLAIVTGIGLIATGIVLKKHLK